MCDAFGFYIGGGVREHGINVETMKLLDIGIGLDVKDSTISFAGFIWDACMCMRLTTTSLNVLIFQEVSEANHVVYTFAHLANIMRTKLMGRRTRDYRRFSRGNILIKALNRFNQFISIKKIIKLEIYRFILYYVVVYVLKKDIKPS